MASSLQSNRGTLVLEGVSTHHYASPAPPHTNNLSGKISQWIAKLDKIPTVMFFSTTLVDFLDQAVQKFQETAKKFDQYVEKANKEEYVCLNCFESRFRILSERMIWNLPLVSSVWVWEGIFFHISLRAVVNVDWSLLLLFFFCCFQWSHCTENQQPATKRWAFFHQPRTDSSGFPVAEVSSTLKEMRNFWSSNQWRHWWNWHES